MCRLKNVAARFKIFNLHHVVHLVNAQRIMIFMVNRDRLMCVLEFRWINWTTQTQCVHV